MPTPGPSPLMSGDRHLSVDEARAAMLAPLRPVAGVEVLPLAQALGRVLAEDLICPMDVPPHDNSAMDGYAFDGALLGAGDAALELALAGTKLAGSAPVAAFPVEAGAAAAAQAPADTAAPAAGAPWPRCVRVTTGAVMPSGLDTVVPQELVTLRSGPAGTVVTVPAGAVRRGENRRKAGEDLARGQVAIARGRVLRPSDLGLAASLGCVTLAVRRRVRVALVSTGDELRNPGEPLPAGCIYDSNRASLAAALQRLGVEVVDCGLVPDEPQALEAVFADAAARCDAVVTSGGVSVGEADHTRAMLARLGEVAFWKVAMRPGRPFAFGPLRRPGGAPAEPAWLFALPGNPVAALVTFYAFVRDALRVLAGAEAGPPMALRVRSAAPIRKRPGRTEFQRAIVERDASGEWTARLTGAQGAGILRSLSEANALLVLPHDQGSVPAGDPVEVWLFDGLV
jgi:molybdopterin molybdotransferase